MMLYNTYKLSNQYSQLPTLWFLDFRYSVIESLLSEKAKVICLTGRNLHVPTKCQTSGRKLRKRCRWCFQKGIKKDSVNAKEARRFYHDRYPNRVLLDSRTFENIHLRLSESGSFEVLNIIPSRQDFVKL